MSICSNLEIAVFLKLWFESFINPADWFVVNQNGQLFPTKLRMTSMGAKLNPQICPRNAELVAYICNHDIWVTHTVSGSNVRITYAHKGGRNLADDPLSAGVPSYVMQEEFSRYQGFWWQPKCAGECNLPVIIIIL